MSGSSEHRGSADRSGESVDEILHACLARPEEEWAAAVDEACLLHPLAAADLRARFERLRAFGLATGTVSASSHVGGYELLELVGGGSMGTVHRARGPGGEVVALKLLREGLRMSASARRRFQREQELVARLRHAGIAAVRDAGEADGVPWLALEFVEGEGLAARLERLPGAPDDAELRARVALVARVAEALEAAHAVGLVHRDVKPGNVVVSADGRPVLVDFGLARDLGDEDARLTESGATLGSPAYLAPETITGSTQDARADVYALGVLLYECVTGALPFRAPTRAALFRAILREEAVDTRRLNSRVDADLACMVGVALEKEPGARYASAEALAADLNAWLRGESIAARRPGLLVRTSRWVRRNRGATSFLGLLALGLVVTGLLLVQVSRGLRRARALGMADAAANVEPELAVLLARRGLQALDHPATRGELAHAMARYHPRVMGPAGDGAVRSCVFLADDRRLASLSITGVARIVDERGALVAELAGVRRIAPGPGADELLVLRAAGLFLWRFEREQLEPLVVAPERVLDARALRGEESEVVALLTRGADGRTASRRWPSGEERTLAPSGTVRRGRLGASGARAWLVGDGEIASFGRDGERESGFAGDTLLAASASGDDIVAGMDGHTAWLRWEGGAWSLLREFDDRERSFAFSADGTRLAILEERARAWLLEAPPVAASVRTIGAVPPRGVFVESFALSADGRWLALGGGDGVVRLHAADGRAVGALHGHDGHLTALEFRADGEVLASGSYDGRVGLHRARPGLEHVLRGAGAGVVDVDTRPGAVGWVDASGTLREAAAGAVASVAEGVVRAAYVRDGAGWLLARADGRIEYLPRDAGDGQGSLLALLPEDDQVEDLSAAPHGWRAVLATRAGRILLFEDAGDAFADPVAFDAGVALLSADVSADGMCLAAGGSDGVVRLFGRDGTQRASFVAHGNWIRSVRFAPDGLALVTGSRDNTACLWSLEGELLASLAGHRGTVARAVFSADGRFVATASTDGTAGVWTRAGGQVCLLRGHSGQVWDVAFGRDGQELVSGAFDGDVRRWAFSRDALLAESAHLVTRSLSTIERALYHDLLGE